MALQPYGSLFFAAAPVVEASLPALTEGTRHAVVILRLRGRTDLGTGLMDVLRRYALTLAATGVQAGPRLGRRARPGTAPGDRRDRTSIGTGERLCHATSAWAPR